MAHLTTPEGESLLDKEIRVLDNGFVKLLDYMGTDERVLHAARMSYGQPAVDTPEKRTNLINQMVENGHTSPFEQVVLTFEVKMPIFVARQWIRHRTARVNEESMRYKDFDPINNLYVPKAIDVVCRFDKEVGADTNLSELANSVIEEIDANNDGCIEQYISLRKNAKCSKELARVTLPLSMYTTFVWQIDLHNLMHFLHLRMGSHAQLEIRAYATELYKITRAICPISMQAFTSSDLKGCRLNDCEISYILSILQDTVSEYDQNTNVVAKKTFEKLMKSKANVTVPPIELKNR